MPSIFLGPNDVAPATIDNLQQILAGKYFFLAALTILLYDHVVTFPDEIQTVWKKKKTYVLYLFIVVRYYAPIAVSIVAFGYFSTVMTRERCANWMLFLPLGVTMPLSVLPGMLMLVRVYALYNRNRIILFGLGTILLAQTIAGIWQYTVKGGTPAPDPIDNYEFHFCIYLPPKKIGHVSTMYVFMELGYDTLIFLLTILRTTYMYWRHQGSLGNANTGTPSLIANLIRDGAFYFGIIFSMNLMWVLMIMHAPTGLRAIASIPAACVTTVMICRITLNLRTTVYGPAQIFERTQHNIPLSEIPKSPRMRRSNYAPFDPTATENLQVHVQTDVERSFPFAGDTKQKGLGTDSVTAEAI